MITTLVLDLDGPLLDGRQRHHRCYSDILRQWKFEPLALDRYWQLKRERMDGRSLLALSGAEARHDEFLAEWLRRIEARDYLALDRLQAGVPEILTSWKQKRLRLLLATMRHDRAALDWQLDSLGLAALLDDVVMIASGGAGGKAAAVRPLLKDSGQAMWIGDTELDIQAARSLGLRCCLVTCGLRTDDYLAGLSPDLLAPDFATVRDWVAKL